MIEWLISLGMVLGISLFIAIMYYLFENHPIVFAYVLQAIIVLFFVMVFTWVVHEAMYGRGLNNG